ncbi:alpha-1,2-mannosidase [Aquipluma nitroreducens]|uniref:Alpha-1,2-mannosidase n=1 Tax=Aquipluma nitroreducens TaxID=2010828 RepID=A0A5K7SDC5_9BACT|nr:glycoside hydrolase family 43 protein [Aquipluma nitroreducens]BBE19583.1 alpha-1,2-mannosidase [Aquipluma nitroreducens]
MTKKQFILLLAIGIISGICTAQTKQTKTSGNPIMEGWYADPEGALFDNTFWVYPTYSAKYEEQTFLDAISSEDLVHWKKYSHIIDTSAVKWANRAMWAPCIVKKDANYYLFFSVNDIQAPFRDGYVAAENKIGGIGIGISSKPEGPFRDYLGKPLIQEFYNKAQPIDQFVFHDKDGQYYIIYGGWGHCNIAKLNNDFTGLVPYPDGNTVKEITPEGYVEGPLMFIRNGKYYMMWSEGGWTNDSYKAAYGISDSPFGPFKKMGTILKSDPAIATGAGHHSVVNIPGTDEWYIFYHRRPIPSEGRDHRVVCVDRMYFNPDGTIQPVKMTWEGVPEIKVK